MGSYLFSNERQNCAGSVARQIASQLVWLKLHLSHFGWLVMNAPIS
jgi:hypothetical protein